MFMVSLAHWAIFAWHFSLFSCFFNFGLFRRALAGRVKEKVLQKMRAISLDAQRKPRCETLIVDICIHLHAAPQWPIFLSKKNNVVCRCTAAPARGR
jgi:hypothetical protein